MSINKSIKPNVFLFKNLSNEDHFTNSLGYILNLFPNELGKRFLSKLADLVGYQPDYFGEFVEAKFAGHYLVSVSKLYNSTLLWGRSNL